jgi:MOSC domain-containing protein YiiM
MGTVATLDAATVVVKDRDGKSVSIHVTKDTKYEKGGVTAAAADLKVGERVMVEATGKEGDFTAAEIHFGSIPHDGDHHEHQ